MLVLVIAVLVGAAIGWCRPALGARCQRIRIGRLPLLATGALGVGAARLAPADIAPLVMGGALAVLLAFALANARVTGIAVIGVGLLLNLVAVVVNNGVPVRSDALVVAGVLDQRDVATADLGSLRHLETGADRLAVLGDIVPIPAARSVLSFGDLIIVVGAADAVRDLARRRRRPWTATDRLGYDSAMTQLRAVHDWGTAPSASPESGSQYSAKPDRDAPAVIDLTSSPPRYANRPLVADTHIR